MAVLGARLGVVVLAGVSLGRKKLIDPNLRSLHSRGRGFSTPPCFPPRYTNNRGLGFVLLWALRTKWAKPGQIFAAYLMFNGFERFWIEKIRVNTTFNVAGITMTQAELISVCTFLSGVTLWAWTTKRN